MISIGIPVYNESPDALLNYLRKHLDNNPIYDEIIIYDDASLKPLILKEPHQKFKLLRGKNNLGDVGARKAIAMNSKNTWILFLDSDMLPITENFLSIYSNCIKSGHELYYGGIEYSNESIQTTSLRYQYGKNREVRTPTDEPSTYKYFVSASFLIKKNIFLDILHTNLKNVYGLDVFLSMLLQEKNIKVLFVENRALHLGIEDNKTFIEKSQKSAQLIASLVHEKKIPPDWSRLSETGEKMKRFQLARIFIFCYGLMRPFVIKNLLSKKPFLKFLDLERLYHYLKFKTSSFEF